MKKENKYRVLVDPFYESGALVRLQERDENGDWVRMSFPDAGWKISFPNEYYDLEKVFGWDGEEWFEYVYAMIYAQYHDYELPNGDRLSDFNTIILEEETFEEYTFDEISIYNEKVLKELYKKVVIEREKDILEKVTKSLGIFLGINIREEIFHNYAAKGSASKTLIEKWDEEKAELNMNNGEIKSIIFSMQAARKRHQETDYDSFSKKGMTDEQIAKFRYLINK